MTGIECKIGGLTLKTVDIYRLEYEACANQPTRLSVRVEAGFYEKPEWAQAIETLALGSAASFQLTPPEQSVPLALFSGVLSERRYCLEDHQLHMELICHCSAIKAGEGVLGYARNSKVKDDALFKDVLQKAGVTLAGEQAQATVEYSQRVLPPVSPWLFARHLAAANGLVILSGKDGVSLHKPQAKGSPLQLKLTDHQIIGMDLGQNGESAIPDAKVDAWSIKEQKAVSTQASQSAGPLKTIAGKLGRKTVKLRRSDPASKAACEAEALARTTRAALAFQQGSIELEGYLAVSPGGQVKIDKVPAALQGPYWVGGVRIELDRQGLRTILQLGLDPERFDPPAPLPPPPLMHGVIQPYKDDPDALQRLPVKLQGLSEPDNVVWARLATPLAGKDRGLYLPLQPNDEVIVGFLGDCWDYPAILGAVHNPKQKPPFPYGKEMPKHALVLEKDKLQLAFDAKDKNIVLASDDKTDLKLSAKDGLIARQNKDNLTLKQGAALNGPNQGITLSGKKASIKSDGNVDIKVSGSVNIS
ncbi:phage baseplate assembly protein V [Chromobacterium vaccinii]|uniref:phage baseplate assembly protein V n=1 Tax=Chromobacterium vaccinii TaxID=1108595 RepID=UPI0031E270CB